MENYLIKKKQNLSDGIVFAVLVTVLFIFSYVCHPQVILDYDDWSYIAYSRWPIPWPTFWNPSRVFPETFMPACGYFGALIYHLFPRLGYIRAEALGTSLILALTESFYFFFFYRLIQKELRQKETSSYVLVTLLVLMHFLVFRKNESGNSYLFYTANMTCCYFYLIPALLNACLVLYFLTYPEKVTCFVSQGKYGSKFCLIFLLYFLLFSNLYASIILASYAGWKILGDFFAGKRKLRSFLQLNSLYFGILTVFAVAVLFEAVGGRAQHTYQGNANYIENLKLTLHYYAESWKQFNSLWICLAGTGVGTVLLMVVQNKRSGIKNTLWPESILCFLTVTAFAILISAKADPAYIKRPEVQISMFFYLYLLIFVGFIQLVKKFSQTKYLLYGIIILSFVVTNPKGRTFAESYSIDCPITPETCIAVSQDLVDQMISADQAGEKKIILAVMFTGEYGSSNWPQVTYMGEPFQKALIRHGVIRREIDLEVDTRIDFNEKYNLKFPRVEALLLSEYME